MASVVLAVALTLSTVPSVKAQPAGCPEIVEAFFGERAPQACKVAWCESRYDFDAVSPGGANVGLFQINRRSWGWRASTDPDTNVRFAYELSRGGYDWSNWSCRP